MTVSTLASFDYEEMSLREEEGRSQSQNKGTENATEAGFFFTKVSSEDCREDAGQSMGAVRPTTKSLFYHKTVCVNKGK